MEVGGKIDMLTHTDSLIKNALDKKHPIEAVSVTIDQYYDTAIC